MSEANDLDEKVRKLLTRVTDARLGQLDGSSIARGAIRVVQEAFSEFRDADTAYEIGEHLTDWNSEAAFIVALILFPEEFSRDEIRDGVIGFAIHAPNHVAAAAHLLGYPVDEIFDLLACGDPDEQSDTPPSVVILDPDLAPRFKDGRAVNEALRRALDA